MLESALEIKAADGVLAGTLCLPSDVDLPLRPDASRSGPLDRDENVEGQRLDIFNTIAHQLAQRGFASLRYDSKKRGCGSRRVLPSRLLRFRRGCGRLLR